MLKGEGLMDKLESFMIMCMTRRTDCTPEKCLTCGWLRDETKEWLNKHGTEVIDNEVESKDGN